MSAFRNLTPEKPETAIIGAGPVGSLLSIFLARRGMSVDLFERRSDMRQTKVEAGRSINLAISCRGIHALKQLGLDGTVLSQAVPMKGRMIHSMTGTLTFQRYGKDDSESIHSISRAGLNEALMTAAEATGKVRIHFDQKVTECDSQKRSLSLQCEKSGERRQIFPEVLVGTDGSASAVRKAVASAPQASCSEQTLDYGYKELHISSGPKGSFQLEKNALHIWPRGTFMLIALPNFDGSFTLTLFLPLEGLISFASLNTPQLLNRFFSEQFPDVMPLIATLEESFFSNPTGRMITVRCSPWSIDDWALLLGDAAHAIVPFFGQGMNCGFEDCTLLAERIDSLIATKTPWNRSFAQFSLDRKPDTDAIADLAIENFVEMRDKVGNPAFLMEKEVEKILEHEFPELYLSRYRMVTFHQAPYRIALQTGKLQSELLRELCRGLDSPQNLDREKAHRLIQERLKDGLRT